MHNMRMHKAGVAGGVFFLVRLTPKVRIDQHYITIVFSPSAVCFHVLIVSVSRCVLVISKSVQSSLYMCLTVVVGMLVFPLSLSLSISSWLSEEAVVIGHCQAL